LSALRYKSLPENAFSILLSEHKPTEAGKTDNPIKIVTAALRITDFFPSYTKSRPPAGVRKNYIDLSIQSQQNHHDKYA
jgi:hypothetical protein